ncbi:MULTISPECIES: APC family permease [unclassified Schlesneria]|uniref:APC family permease n=1 Tax=unclassified Schlesneria TaxID=2762017 RepID=UPI002EE1A2E3
MSNPETPHRVAPKTLPRVLGLVDSTALVIGSIIGSGIFLKVGKVDQALMAWGYLPIIGVWVFVGLITLCGSLALAELAAMYPQAGGPYLYLREAYGQLPAFLWGWTEFWVIRTGSVGALVCATAIYLDEFLRPSGATSYPLGHYGQFAASLIIITGLTAINIFSTRWGAAVQNVATAAKLVFLALLIGLPLLMGKMNLEHLSPLWVSSPETTIAPETDVAVAETADSASQSGPTSRTFLAAFGVALIAVFWPYDGWINIAPVAEEIREPQKNVPRALGIGILTVVLVYAGANLSYHLVLSMSAVANSTTLASDVFRVLFGEWGSKFAALGVCCSTFGAANSNLIAGPRIYFAASRDGLVPNYIQQVHPRYHTPANSILIQGIWTSLMIIAFYATSPNPKEVFDLITDAVICAGLIFYSLAVGAVYILRVQRPAEPRPYRTWGYPITPGLLIATYLLALIGTLIEQWDKLIWVLALIAAGIVYYALIPKSKTDTATE